MFKDNKRFSATDTLIGQGTQMEGKLICEANLRIEGEFSGDIECLGDVIIGESGVARSTIHAKEITIAGKVFGDIVAKGRLTVTATGQITGSVTAQSLIIHDGGLMNGSCHMERSQDIRTRPLSETDGGMQQSKDSASREKDKARQAG
ncbi:polymer-forming cytoskeletal protein [Paenibacillus sp. NEAU-GSW1]|uniref:bactofilin family protein n=1 Tax=Paenibacillus sp. NEAU-GSW1 TaxID=2682486 RepID=UPI0012E10825|nr:polymer-forming cytoskeletal protein [Paenibacillus sp. NEAU-GSW1]MUT67645.1 polymer-forming cytoskeletal protein [Paenibacillus sp. NEAU-GSW1]